MYARKLKNFSLTLMLSSLLLVCAAQAEAEPPPATSGDADLAQQQYIRIYKISYADPKVVLNAINELVRPAPTFVDRSQDGLTLAGTDEQFAAVEAVLSQLDQPPAELSRPTYITLAHRSIDQGLRRLLDSVVSDKSTIAVDSPTRTILVRGSDADVSAVQALVEVIDKSMDQPSRVLELTFFFLKSPSSGLPGRVSQLVPAFLEPVAHALVQNGFRNPSLMTPLIVRTQENYKFGTSGALTEAVTEAAADRAAHDKFAKVIPDVNLPHTMLESAIDHIRSVGDANIVVRWNMLEFAGIDRNAPVNVRLRDVTLETALRCVLDSAGGLVGANVAYVVDEGVVVISTREDLREKYGSHQTPLQVRVEGKARLLDPGKSAQLDVEAEVYLPPSGGSPMSGGAPEAPKSLFRVETALTLPLGEYVVLAAGPVAPDVGQGIAMVVRAEVVGYTSESETRRP